MFFKIHFFNFNTLLLIIKHVTKDLEPLSKMLKEALNPESYLKKRKERKRYVIHRTAVETTTS